MAEEAKVRSRSAKELKWHQKVLLAFVALVLKLWMRSIRIDETAAKAVLEAQPGTAAVVLFWHNRSFLAPEFYRRHGRGRRLAALVSASADGAWSAGFLKRMGVLPVRGSAKRGRVESMRVLVRSLREGYDIAVTPDGSRGPVYEVKPGAISVAMKAEAPVVLVSFNFDRAYRLRSWDGFYLPWPFSRARALAEVVDAAELASMGEDPRDVAQALKARLAALTVDG